MGINPILTLLSTFGLSSTKRSILMMVIAWTLNLLWLGLNYFWDIAGTTLLIAVPVFLLAYSLAALIAYVYWGIRDVKEKDAPYANVVVGSIVGFTLLYFNYQFLQFIIELSR